MTLFVYAPLGRPPIFGASLETLKVDYPNTDFPPFMTVEQKAEFNLYQVTSTEPPSIDPATQRLLPAHPTLIDGKWTQQWQVIDLTQEEQKSLQPARWEVFERLAIGDSGFQSLIALGLQASTTAALRLPVSMSDIRYNGEIAVASFRNNWVKICRALNAPRSEVERFAAAAQLCNLPDYFIQAILAPIPEEEQQ